jgi:hypothetical protein
VNVPRLCEQRTAAGKPCKNHALAAKTRCASHAHLAGRKVSFDAETGERIVEMITEGVSLAAAAHATGVGRATVFRWLSRPEPMFSVFREHVAQARAAAQEALVAQLVATASAKPQDWQDAVRLLEQATPARYGDRRRDSDAPRETDPFAAFV